MVKLSDIFNEIEVKDQSAFHEFTNKWIGYVISGKKSFEIGEDEWKKLLGRTNPVAGIDRGEMLDVAVIVVKDKKTGIKTKETRNTNEQKNFKDGWDTGLRDQILQAINTPLDKGKLDLIRKLREEFTKIVTKGKGRNMDQAMNRLITTFFPDLFIKSPDNRRLKAFIDLLHKYVENGSSIKKAKKWIENSYNVRQFFKNELEDDNQQLSEWDVYKTLEKHDNNNSFPGSMSMNNSNATINSTEYDEFIQLLKGNYNLILTGAPGTGKTYLAKRIAEEMGAKKEDGTCKLVQFHPSYDYTDFVEGLRPIKEGDKLGFQRKDGVFKAFCKKALKNSIKLDVDSALKAFQSDLKRGGITIKSHKTDTSFEVRLGDKNYKIFTTSENCPEDGYNCAFDAVRNYIINGTYIEGHQTYQPSIGEYVKETYMKGFTYVFIIDEINRGEISKIFGELFYSIDPGYRCEDGMVDTQYQNLIPKEGDDEFKSLKPEEVDVFRNGFYVPENVYIIGTMNDIDRSVESMDFAMRRRFAWKEITAKSRQSMLDEDQAWDGNKPTQDIINEIKARMDNLNACIIDQYGGEELSPKDKIGLTKAYQIGAAYFLKYNMYGNFDDLWDNHLEGLLYEYLRGSTNIKDKIERLHSAYNDTTAH